jgi:hypothetical protein
LPRHGRLAETDPAHFDQDHHDGEDQDQYQKKNPFHFFLKAEKRRFSSLFIPQFSNIWF